MATLPHTHKESNTVNTLSVTLYDRMHAVTANEIMSLDVLHLRVNGAFVSFLVTDVVSDDAIVIVEGVTEDGNTTITLNADVYVWVAGDGMAREDGEVEGVNNEFGVVMCDCDECERMFYEIVRHPESFYVQGENGEGLVPECVLNRREVRRQQARDGVRDPLEVTGLPFGPTFTPDPIVDGLMHDVWRMQYEAKKRAAWNRKDAVTPESQRVEVKPYVDEAAEFIKLAERKEARKAAPVLRDALTDAQQAMQRALDAIAALSTGS